MILVCASCGQAVDPKSDLCAKCPNDHQANPPIQRVVAIPPTLPLRGKPENHRTILCAHCGASTSEGLSCRNLSCLRWPEGAILRCFEETIVIDRDGSVVFGRLDAPECLLDQFSQMDNISARHVTVSWCSDGVVLFDDSLNGTTFNGIPLVPRTNFVVKERGTIVLGRKRTVTIEVVHV
jgi:hypothetical protein